MAQAPGQKGAFVPDSTEPRRIDTKALPTDTLLPMSGARQGSGCPIAATWAGASRLVRARYPDLPVLWNRRLRPLARYLETFRQPNGGVGKPAPNEGIRSAEPSLLSLVGWAPDCV